MTEGSNTKARIAELRQRIQTKRAIAKRAEDARVAAIVKRDRANEAVRFAREEIEEMGGKVRR